MKFQVAAATAGIQLWHAFVHTYTLELFGLNGAGYVGRRGKSFPWSLTMNCASSAVYLAFFISIVTAGLT